MKRVKILKYFINPIKKNVLLKKIINWCKNKKLKSSKYICVSSVHGASESVFNKKYRKSHNNCDLALADGRPIYWALKLLGSKNIDHLPGYLVTNSICNLAEKNQFKIGIYGGQNYVIKKFIIETQKLYKNLKFNYSFSPPFRSLSLKENKNIIKKINDSKVDILFVCLGAPKQEIWMHENQHNLKCVMIGIGAALDYLAKTKTQPPLILEKFGLAWFFRLIIEPKRLFKRYLIANTIFLTLFISQLVLFWLKKLKNI